MHVVAGDLRVVVSRDGELACLVEPRQVLVFALPGLERVGEIGVDDETDAALVGDHLAVLAASGLLHVVEPRGKDGPEKLAELAVDPGTRILATSGEHMLLAAAGGAAIATLGDRPTLARLPSRTTVAAAGPGTQPDRFVVATGGVLEEWSATSRAPIRRFRLDRPVAARHVGATSRYVWFVPEATPAQMIVLPAAGTGRPVAIDLPEPALRLAADPAGHHAAMVGGDTRAVFTIGLADGKTQQIHPGEADDVSWRAGSVVCAAGSLIEVIELARPGGRVGAEKAADVSPRERLAAWKQKVAARPEPVPSPDDDDAVIATHEWRDALVRWARRVLAGGQADPPLLAAGPLHDVGIRLGMLGDDAMMLWLIYAARLCGHDGVAPADLVEVCPRRWDDALGNSELAGSGAFRWRRSRVELMPEIVAALDERPPLYGTAVASPIGLARTVAVHAPGADLDALGAQAAPRLGALLVPTARGLAHPARFLLEARARGIAPMIPWRRFEPRTDLLRDRAVIVVDDPATAAELSLPLITVS